MPPFQTTPAPTNERLEFFLSYNLDGDLRDVAGNVTKSKGAEDENGILSNCALTDFTIRGVKVRSLENAWQATKRLINLTCNLEKDAPVAAGVAPKTEVSGSNRDYLEVLFHPTPGELPGKLRRDYRTAYSVNAFDSISQELMVQLMMMKISHNPSLYASLIDAEKAATAAGKDITFVENCISGARNHNAAIGDTSAPGKQSNLTAANIKANPNLVFRDANYGVLVATDTGEIFSSRYLGDTDSKGFQNKPPRRGDNKQGKCLKEALKRLKDAARNNGGDLQVVDRFNPTTTTDFLTPPNGSNISLDQAKDLWNGLVISMNSRYEELADAITSPLAVTNTKHTVTADNFSSAQTIVDTNKNSSQELILRQANQASKQIESKTNYTTNLANCRTRTTPLTTPTLTTTPKPPYEINSNTLDARLNAVGDALPLLFAIEYSDKSRSTYANVEKLLKDGNRVIYVQADKDFLLGARNFKIDTSLNYNAFKTSVDNFLDALKEHVKSTEIPAVFPINADETLSALCIDGADATDEKKAYLLEKLNSAIRELRHIPKTPATPPVVAPARALDNFKDANINGGHIQQATDAQNTPRGVLGTIAANIVIVDAAGTSFNNSGGPLSGGGLSGAIKDIIDPAQLKNKNGRPTDSNGNEVKFIATGDAVVNNNVTKTKDGQPLSIIHAVGPIGSLSSFTTLLQKTYENIFKQFIELNKKNPALVHLSVPIMSGNLFGGNSRPNFYAETLEAFDKAMTTLPQNMHSMVALVPYTAEESAALNAALAASQGKAAPNPTRRAPAAAKPMAPTVIVPTALPDVGLAALDAAKARVIAREIKEGQVEGYGHNIAIKASVSNFVDADTSVYTFDKFIFPCATSNTNITHTLSQAVYAELVNDATFCDYYHNNAERYLNLIGTGDPLCSDNPTRASAADPATDPASVNRAARFEQFVESLMLLTDGGKRVLAGVTKADQDALIKRVHDLYSNSGELRRIMDAAATTTPHVQAQIFNVLNAAAAAIAAPPHLPILYRSSALTITKLIADNAATPLNNLVGGLPNDIAAIQNPFDFDLTTQAKPSNIVGITKEALIRQQIASRQNLLNTSGGDPIEILQEKNPTSFLSTTAIVAPKITATSSSNSVEWGSEDAKQLVFQVNFSSPAINAPYEAGTFTPDANFGRTELKNCLSSTAMAYAAFINNNLKTNGLRNPHCVRNIADGTTPAPIAVVGHIRDFDFDPRKLPVGAPKLGDAANNAKWEAIANGDVDPTEIIMPKRNPIKFNELSIAADTLNVTQDEPRFGKDNAISIKALFDNSLAGFQLAKKIADSKGLPCKIETGLFGVEEGNNAPEFSIAMQYLAARIAGVNIEFREIDKEHLSKVDDIIEAIDGMISDQKSVDDIINDIHREWTVTVPAPLANPPANNDALWRRKVPEKVKPAPAASTPRGPVRMDADNIAKLETRKQELKDILHTDIFSDTTDFDKKAAHEARVTSAITTIVAKDPTDSSPFALSKGNLLLAAQQNAGLPNAIPLKKKTLLELQKEAAAKEKEVAERKEGKSSANTKKDEKVTLTSDTLSFRAELVTEYPVINGRQIERDVPKTYITIGGKEERMPPSGLSYASFSGLKLVDLPGSDKKMFPANTGDLDDPTVPSDDKTRYGNRNFRPGDYMTGMNFNNCVLEVDFSEIHPDVLDTIMFANCDLSKCNFPAGYAFKISAISTGAKDGHGNYILSTLPQHHSVHLNQEDDHVTVDGVVHNPDTNEPIARGYYKGTFTQRATDANNTLTTGSEVERKQDGIDLSMARLRKANQPSCDPEAPITATRAFKKEHGVSLRGGRGPGSSAT